MTNTVEVPSIESEDTFQDSELHSAEGFMYRDRPLTPKMISSLMHVDATLTSVYDHEERMKKPQVGERVMYVLGVLLASVLVTIIIGGAFLYAHNLAPFYDPVEAHQSR